MRQLLLSFLILALSVPRGPLALAQESLEPGNKMKANLTELRPTQFVVGMKEVEIRKAKLQKLKTDESALKKYMKSNRARVVVGPGEELYIIDGHHFGRMLDDAGYNQIYIEIERNWSDHTQEEFWQKMKKKNWVYLKDESGRLRSVQELPEKLSQLADDPYRSLAWLVRKAGGYEALETPFQEFYWADFYRTRIPAFDGNNRIAFDQAFDRALVLSKSSDAAGLPGHLGKLAINSCTLGKLILKLSH
ncbi:MAG TPA: hypothetical protein DCS07_11665 [Bdellovibrionales bacterium]|nr:hypothetical protein [Bdellovibrionales bacterium]HCM40147.1 hypothetical protein [Bdellovibrionales bacterium]